MTKQLKRVNTRSSAPEPQAPAPEHIERQAQRVQAALDIERKERERQARMQAMAKTVDKAGLGKGKEKVAFNMGLRNRNFDANETEHRLVSNGTALESHPDDGNSPETRYALPTPTELHSGAEERASAQNDQPTQAPVAVAGPSGINIENEKRTNIQKTVDTGEKEGSRPRLDAPRATVRDAKQSDDDTEDSRRSQKEDGEAADTGEESRSQAEPSNPVVQHAVEQAAEQLANAGIGAERKVASAMSISLNELEDLIKGTAKAVAASTAQPALDGMKQLVEQIGNLTQAVAATQARSPRPQQRSAVRVSDIRIPEFSGNSDPNACHIAETFFLPLLRWIKEGQSTLKLSGLAIPDQCTVVLNHLTGAARASFFAKYGNTDRSRWNLDDTYKAIANLVPDYEVLFTRTALEMKFQAKNLVDDINTFAMYLRHGSFALDGNHFIFCELQQKMIKACPKIFTLAADLHNLRLVWNPKNSFLWHVRQAIDIVNALQANQQLLAQQVSTLTNASGASTSAGKQAEDKAHKHMDSKKRKTAPGPSEGGKSKAPKLDAAKKERYASLAREHKRCRKCGYYVADANWTAHANSGQCDPSQFNMRMGKVAKMVDAGQGAKVNEFAKK